MCKFAMKADKISIQRPRKFKGFPRNFLLFRENTVQTCTTGCCVYRERKLRALRCVHENGKYARVLVYFFLTGDDRVGGKNERSWSASFSSKRAPKEDGTRTRSGWNKRQLIRAPYSNSQRDHSKSFNK